MTFSQPYPSYEVSTDADQWNAVSKKAKTERREAAVSAILARAPESDRASILQLLNTNRGNAGFSASKDPEIARHLSTITSIDALEHLETATSTAGRQTQKDYLANRIRVVVALVPNLNANGARATIIRTPNDGGKPLLLLDEKGVTDADVIAGLQAAANSLHKHPNSPSKEVRFDLRGNATKSSATHNTAGVYRAHLRAGLIRSLDGIGNVRVTEMLTDPPTGIAK